MPDEEEVELVVNGTEVELAVNVGVVGFAVDIVELAVDVVVPTGAANGIKV